jgi:hypothetical protein
MSYFNDLFGLLRDDGPSDTLKWYVGADRLSWKDREDSDAPESECVVRRLADSLYVNLGQFIKSLEL